MRVHRLAAILAITLCGAATSRADDGLFGDYPFLRSYLFSEPQTNFYLGVGLSPLGLSSSRFSFNASVFQVHYITGRWNLELLNTSIGFASGQTDAASYSDLVVRAAPKYEILGGVSLGPLIGYELITFSDVTAKITKNNQYSPKEPFSSRGVIFGGVLSEDIALNKTYSLKVNQVLYRQNYSTRTSNHGWGYYYTDTKVENDPDHTLVKPATVFQIEICLLF